MAKQTFTTGSVLTAAQMNSLQANDYNWTVSQKTASYVLVAADAGTRIEMNAAGATTVTVNTGLFTAGDTLFIQNIGAGACTVTAGTATVNKATAGSLTLAQYQGGTLYFVSASSAIFFADAGYTPPLTTKGDLFTYSTDNTRLAVGANNTVLTADSTTATGLKWATASTPSFTLLGTGTTTSGSTVTVSGISGINQILVYFNAMRCNTAGAEFRLRLNGDTASNYTGSLVRFNVGSSNNSTDISNTTFFRLATTSASTDTIGGGVMLFGGNSTNTKIVTINSGPSYTGTTGGISYVGNGYYSGSSTISSVSVVVSTGAFDSGSFLVYGSA